MGTVNLPQVEPQAHRTMEEYVRYLANILAIIQEDLQNILEGRLSANNIRAESIETKNLKAGIITTEKLAVGAVTADRIDVNQLSAIAADLGTITAGLLQAVSIIGSTITGSLIQTSASSYPRAEMRSSDQMFMAASDALNYMRIIASVVGVPSFGFGDGTNSGSLSFSNDLSGTKKTRFVGSNGIDIQSNNANIDFITGLFKTTFLDWNSVYNRIAGQTLQQALDGKKNTGGFSGTIPPGSTIFVSNGEITGYV